MIVELCALVIVAEPEIVLSTSWSMISLLLTPSSALARASSGPVALALARTEKTPELLFNATEDVAPPLAVCSTASSIPAKAWAVPNRLPKTVVV